MANNEKQDRWFLPTNTENLKVMMAQGLITDPSGFANGKYYEDVLKDYAPNIPLFKNSSSKITDAIKSAAREEANLTCCLLEIDMTKHNDMPIQADADVIEVLAPLPLSVIKQIIVETAEVKSALEAEQMQSSNFILGETEVSKAKKNESELFSPPTNGTNVKEEGTTQSELFSPPTKDGDPNVASNADSTNDCQKGASLQGNDVQESNPTDYPKIYAYGGLLMNLFYSAKNGKISNETFEKFCNKPTPEQRDTKGRQPLSEKVVNDLHQWLWPNSAQGENMLFPLFNTIVKSTKDNFKDEIFKFLNKELGESISDSLQHQQQKSQKRFKEISTTLKNFEDKNDELSSAQKFEKAEQGLERALMLLFYVPDEKDYLDDTNNNVIEKMKIANDKHNEVELVAYYALFGIRTKFISIPVFLRKYNGLQNFVSFKMAQYAHQTNQTNQTNSTNISFEEPKSPKTIYSMIEKPKKQIIKNLKLDKCVESIMPGNFKREGTKNIHPGFIEPTYQLNEDELFCTMSKEKIDEEIYNKLIKAK